MGKCVGSALISLAYLCQMRLLRKDYVRSKPNGKFVSAVCYAINSFSCHKAQVFRSFSVNWCKVKSTWKLFFLISKENAIFQKLSLLEISFEGPFCLCIVLASPFREIALVSNDFVMNIMIKLFI